ncbi:DNA repair protein RadC [Caldimicrobium thiodismutans]|jgi:DNA repair protein RadC|uniref:DNA repair protein RadC n=1 Tax=Caldimicrobium thiodismutans TaxID=1653476 RepID=A0A0U5AFI8_9BACT|nr:DNA repair protein RadC [Caldimicrobium thiodismutans]BAU22780.1 DNA repair protein RadC [Caldimicrobium thiodismutans]
MKYNTEKHYLGHRERLRKRLMQFGSEGLQEYEIVELLLTYVLPQKDVKPIAKELLNKFGSIKGIFDAKEEELKSVRYIKDKFITLIKLIREINIIYNKQKALEKPVFESIDAIAKYCIERIGHKMEEEFLVIYLDSGLKIQQEKDFPAKEFYFSGTIDKTVVYPRAIIEEALKRKSYAIILAHNHPNGKLEPSEYDKNLTKVIEIAAKSVGLLLYDHLIVTANGYLSFKKEKLL